MQNELVFIHRVQKPVTHWSLRFRFKGKVIHRQMFRDDEYAGKEGALAAAKKKRDRIAHWVGVDLDEYWSACKTKSYRYTHPEPSKRNTSGVVGVSLDVWGGSRRYWKASICLTRGREKVKSFNAHKLGEEEAFKQACAQRKQWEEAILPKEQD